MLAANNSELGNWVAKTCEKNQSGERNGRTVNYDRRRLATQRDSTRLIRSHSLFLRDLFEIYGNFITQTANA
jgi:hypothetical protein